ncbi:transcription termination factor Rho [Williamsia limnetica]|uniref:Transcription termination factor Rho n=1 Tax=Williamsia limnetica TaxID=882452 RepID=A0A318RBS2_WILLI|nr:transcription termination factor Rho [Williamsia limnetica]PYE12634.1 transcription termination factor Rho [Williamsia limnetica]
MTDTDLITAPGSENTLDLGGVDTPKAERRRGTGLSGMVLTELRGLAGELGIKGTSGMRKSDLIAAIKERQSGGSAPAPAKAKATAKAPAEKSPAKAEATTAEVQPTAEPKTSSRKKEAATEAPAVETKAETPTAKVAAEPATDGAASTKTSDGTDDDSADGGDQRRQRRRGRESQNSNRDSQSRDNQAGGQNRDGNQGRDGNQNREGQGSGNRNRDDQGNRNRDDQGNRNRDDQGNRNRDDQGNRNRDDQGNRNRDDQGNRNRDDRGNDGQGQNNGPRGNNNNRDNGPGDDDERGGRRGRRFRERRRGRDRNDGPGEGRGGDPQISDDDVLQPVAGILDVLDNYAFVRTSGYLAGPNDVYVSMNLIRKNGLRRGDAITGAVKVVKDGDQSNQRQKFNPLVRLDSVNGSDVETAKKRPEFVKLTPLYPNQRLRLETTSDRISTRVIDLVMPIGKGQRALIVSPPKAGKTTILQNIANAISINNPECYLMVVLVDERPEEVTDMQRSVKGEVIASTFDRPPSDHTSVAELAIERAKRLVEDGKDVVVLLDSITRLGRAYNNASPASGRILSGGVDSTALYPPKRFLGAARNIENGGSLTIIASALVETGSTGDTVIFEEFKGTGNAELKLDRKISERRVFPAVDVNMSSTRKDELLLSPEEFSIVHKLRRVLAGLDSQQAIDLLVSQLKKTKSNVEFLMQVQKTAPGAMRDDD